MTKMRSFGDSFTEGKQEHEPNHSSAITILTIFSYSVE